MRVMDALSRRADGWQGRIEKVLRTRTENGALKNWSFDADADQMRPVFVLSTGRTGTTTLAALMGLSPLVHSKHEPAPRLLATSYAAQQRIKPFCDLPFLQQVLRLERHPAIVAAHRRGQVYFEGSNRMTFLAEALYSLYPKARFLMMTRNPIDFITSAQRRDYYSGHSWDSFRARPTEDSPMASRWQHLSTIQKVSWLWAETYRSSRRSLSLVPNEQCMVLRAEEFFDWDMSLIERLFRFVCDQPAPPESRVRRIMGRKLNEQQAGDALAFADWSDAERTFFEQELLPVALEFGYDAAPAVNGRG